MIALGAHLRNRINYRLENRALKINPILLTDPALLPISKGEIKFIFILI